MAPTLPKMFDTCRATVFWLSTSFSAIARLLSPGGDQPDHLDLSSGEPSRQSFARRDDTEPCEACLCRGPFARGCVGVPERQVGVGQQQAGARGVVRRIELLPGVERHPQHRHRLDRPPLRQPHGSKATVALGTQPGAVEGHGSVDDFLRRGLRERDIARRQPICACATWRGARPSGLPPFGARAAPMEATAASIRPWARRSNASPGCGSRPHSLAWVYAASAPARSPRSRRTSPTS